MRSAALLLSSAFSVLLVTSATRSAAAFDCPPGSFEKTEEGYSWCQPTVCTGDGVGQCDPGQVCRPVNLCMQMGQLGDAGSKVDGGGRLVVTQICGEDKSCPTLQTCSSFGRCLSPATADRLGVNAATATTPAPAAAKKSSCGCEAVGARSGSSGGTVAFGAFGGLAAIALLARARRRASSPRA